MPNSMDQVVEALSKMDEEQLMLHLGMNVKGMSEDMEGRRGSASIDAIDLNVITDINKEIMKFGQRLFKRLNAATYELVCQESFDDGKVLESLKDAIREGLNARAAIILVPVLVSSLGVASPIATIVATLIVSIIVKLLSEAGEFVVDELCNVWGESLQQV